MRSLAPSADISADKFDANASFARSKKFNRTQKNHVFSENCVAKIWMNRASLIEVNMPKNQLPTKKTFRSHRQKIIDAKLERGKRAHNIWTAYSMKIGKDVILIGDAEYCNFVWLEGDPTVASFELETDLFLADKDESHGATYPDAIVIFKNENLRQQWREVKSEEDSFKSDSRDFRQKNIQKRITEELGLDYVRVPPSLLKEHWQFICNWRRAVPFLSAARHLDLQKYETELSAFIDFKSSVTLRECILQYRKEIQPMAIAGVLRCAQRGLIRTDLAKFNLGPSTRLERFRE